MSAIAQHWVHGVRAAVGLGLMVAVLGIAACGDEDEGPPPPRENRPPTVDLTLPGTTLLAFTEGDVVTLRALVDDADDDPLTVEWEVDPGSDGAFEVTSTDPPEAQWTAGSKVGVDTVRVSVSDGKATATDRRTFTLGTLVTASLLNEQWVHEKSPYLVRDDLTVGSNRLLQIGPGVEVLIQGDLAGGALQKPTIIVYGRIEALGTGSLRDERILIQGGRDLTTTANPDRRQHSGLRFLVNGSGRLERVQIEDGVKGVDHRSQGNLTVLDCRLERNDEGYAGVAASHVDMQRTRIRNNFGFGVNINQATARLRGCEIERNKGAGLAIAAQDTIASADVARCDIVNNEGRNVRIDNNGGFLTLIIHESNFGDNELQVEFERCSTNGPGDIPCAPDCTHVELENNYWGFAVDEVDQITDRMEGWFACMPELAGWDPTMWSNTPFSLTP
jgi:hypothetical protein